MRGGSTNPGGVGVITFASVRMRGGIHDGANDDDGSVLLLPLADAAVAAEMF